jgi:hypothetical protein
VEPHPDDPRGVPENPTTVDRCWVTVRQTTSTEDPIVCAAFRTPTSALSDMAGSCRHSDRR